MNPAVTVSMWALGKVSYTEAFVRIAGQMGGGLVSFPLFHALSEMLNLTPFGGPEFSKDNSAEAFLSEFGAMFLLMWAIYIVSLGADGWIFHAAPPPSPLVPTPMIRPDFSYPCLWASR